MPLYESGQEVKLYEGGAEIGHLYEGGVEIIGDDAPAPFRGATLTLQAATNRGNVGAFGQHRDPPAAGRLTPNRFTLGGKTYIIRSWMTQPRFFIQANDSFAFRINFDTVQIATDFIAANLLVDFGIGGHMARSGQAPVRASDADITAGRATPGFIRARNSVIYSNNQEAGNDDVGIFPLTPYVNGQTYTIRISQ